MENHDNGLLGGQVIGHSALPSFDGHSIVIR